MLLQEMEIFYYIVSLGGFTKAANKLHISKAHVSRSVVKLEKELQAPLLHRSTRKFSLTQSGEVLFAHCQDVIRNAEDAYAHLSEFQDTPTGTLRISVPPAFGNALLTKFLHQFLKNYPAISVIVQLENRLVDVIAEGIDVALRSTALKDSELIVVPLTRFENILCASPLYFKRHGHPKKIQDLKEHACCAYSSSHEATWALTKKGKTERILIKSKISANQLEFLKNMILAHQGIGNLPLFMCKKELKEGLLLPCLTDYKLEESDFFAIYSSRVWLPKKTRVFIDELKKFTKEN